MSKEVLQAIKAICDEKHISVESVLSTIEQALAGFDQLSGQKTKLTLVGRIRSIREQGALTFLHFEDGTGKIQALLKEDRVGARNYKFFLKKCMNL